MQSTGCTRCNPPLALEQEASKFCAKIPALTRCTKFCCMEIAREQKQTVGINTNTLLSLTRAAHPFGTIHLRHAASSQHCTTLHVCHLTHRLGYFRRNHVLRRRTGAASHLSQLFQKLSSCHLCACGTQPTLLRIGRIAWINLC